MQTAPTSAQFATKSTQPQRGLAGLLAALSAVGPFTIDAYLPSFRDIGQHFNASPVIVQQTLTLNFSAVFVYIVSGPAFVRNLLHRKETEFYWLFGPTTVGMLIGTWFAGKLAGHRSNLCTLAPAYGLYVTLQHFHLKSPAVRSALQASHTAVYPT